MTNTTRDDLPIRVLRVVIDADRRPLFCLERIPGTGVYRRTFDSPAQACAMAINSLVCHARDHSTRYSKFSDVDELVERARAFELLALRSLVGVVLLLEDDPELRRLARSVLRWLRITREQYADVLREMAPRGGRA